MMVLRWPQIYKLLNFTRKLVSLVVGYTMAICTTDVSNYKENTLILTKFKRKKTQQGQAMFIMELIGATDQMKR